MTTSISEIRKDFPLLMSNDVIYLDTAATSQKPSCVLEAERTFYEKYNANPLRGLYELGEAATEKYEEAREMVREFLNAREAAEIVFVRNATEGLNLVAYSLSSLVLKPGDEILVSIMEHHSNLLPWQQAAARTGAVVKYLECTEDGKYTEEAFRAALSDRTKVVAMTQVSTLSKSLQSGVNRNLYPSTAPGRNATRIARTANRTKKEGIRTLLIFSIPFVAPNIRMAAAMTITSTCQGTLPKFPVAWLK